jgi:hypothetical protein
MTFDRPSAPISLRSTVQSLSSSDLLQSRGALSRRRLQCGQALNLSLSLGSLIFGLACSDSGRSGLAANGGNAGSVGGGTSGSANGGSSGSANGGSSGSANGGSSGSTNGGSSGSANGGGPSANRLSVELYQGFHAQEACAGQITPEECGTSCLATYNGCTAAEQPDCATAYSSCGDSCPSEQPQPCIYADVYFLANCDGVNVHDLSPPDVQVTIGDRNVGVEGSVLLTQQNGLMVDLLLDRSYSIHAADASTTVRVAADGFLEALPPEGRVRVSSFASEANVPEVLGSAGQSHYYRVDAAGPERADLDLLISASYQPYANESSVAFTKLFDAAVGLAESAAPSDISLSALPSVAVIFTDGADTASLLYANADLARAAMRAAKPAMKVYAIGLGEGIDEGALRTLSEQRFYSAANESSLVQVFQEVASKLGAIYRYRVLVPSAVANAEGTLTVSYCNETSVQDFTMGSLDADPTAGTNTCASANDGRCDSEPTCEAGTDSADCGPNACGFAFNGHCEEGLYCDEGTDSTDCGPNGCPTAFDGVCDDMWSCSGGTDSADCD